MYQTTVSLYQYTISNLKTSRSFSFITLYTIISKKTVINKTAVNVFRNFELIILRLAVHTKNFPVSTPFLINYILTNDL